MICVNNSLIYMGSASDTRNVERIPEGNWVIKYSEKEFCFFLERTKEFTLPKKIYGECESLATRYLHTFSKKDGNLGVLFSGLKGTGKSMLARYTAIKSKLPVIIVSEPFHGAEFQTFLSSINHECVVFFDEFEKVYRKEEHQQALLSILDGVFPNKFLFLVTINDTYRLSNFLNNRPGRIHYAKHYDGLPDDIIEDVCKDRLKSKKKTNDIIRACNYLGEVSMDVVTTLIDECNMYPKDSIQTIVGHMNLKPESTDYLVDIFINGDMVANDVKFSENPYAFTNESSFSINWYGNANLYVNSIEGWNNIYFNESCFNTKIKYTKTECQMLFDTKCYNLELATKRDNGNGRERSDNNYITLDLSDDEPEAVALGTEPEPEDVNTDHVFEVKLVFRKKKDKFNGLPF